MNRYGTDNDGRQQPELHEGGPSFTDDFDFTGLEFPVTREGLLEFVQDRKMDRRLAERVRQSPTRAYQSMEIFREEFSQDLDNYGAIKHPHHPDVSNGGH